MTLEATVHRDVPNEGSVEGVRARGSVIIVVLVLATDTSTAARCGCWLGGIDGMRCTLSCGFMYFLSTGIDVFGWIALDMIGLEIMSSCLSNAGHPGAAVCKLDMRPLPLRAMPSCHHVGDGVLLVDALHDARNDLVGPHLV